VNIRILLDWAGLPRSSFYYKRTSGARGRKTSVTTRTSNGEVVDNLQVVTHIEQTLEQEFCCYGYKNVRSCLVDAGFVVNAKKVYRLMKEHNLLFNHKIGVKKSPRKFVRYRKIQTERPMEYMCMDIKYVHIHGSKRNALLLTVIDVYSRKTLTHMLEYNIRKGDVLLLLSLLMPEYNITSFTIRNDNGSQFIANVVREYLKEKGVTQDFTHVANPEENSYIEAYHSIIQREVIERFEFESIHDAKTVFYRYNEWYNQKRKHGSLGSISHEEYLMARA
jgi:putative transposase